MLRNRMRILVTSCAAIALALGGLLAMASPAEAAIIDPPPINEITGPSTELAQIDGLAVSPDGTTYVACESTDSIVGYPKGADGDVAPSVEISGSNTNLDQPNGLGTDSQGNVWVANIADSIEEFAAGANGDVPPIRTISGSATGLQGPTSVAVGPDGEIYVANSYSEDVEIFSANATGNVSPARIITGNLTEFGNLYPYGIALAPDGSIVVSDLEGAIQTFAADASGDVSALRTIIGPDTGLNYNYYVAVDQLGDIFAGNYEGASITEYPESASGDATPIAEIEGPASALAEPEPVAVDTSDNLFVGNYQSSSVTEYGAALAVNGVTPSTGTTTGGETLTVHGYGFTSGATVTVGGAAATDVTVISSTTLTAVAPAHAAGNVDVAVNDGGRTVTDARAFTYTPALATTGVDPAPALAAGILLALVGVLLIARRVRRAHAA